MKQEHFFNRFFYPLSGSVPTAYSSLLAHHSALILGGNSGHWNYRDRLHEEPTMNGVEAWVFALRGGYKPGIELERSDLEEHDLIILNLNFPALHHYGNVLRDRRGGGARVVGLYEGDLAALNQQWRFWSAVADRCDLVIGINGFGIDLLASLTSTPVRYIGIPYPVDGVRSLSVPVEERRREIFLCTPLLHHPTDYLAARSLGLPMYGFEETFSRNLRSIARQRSLDKHRYIRRARQLYNDPLLSVLPRTHLPGFFERTARSLLWMNLDPRYTWGRYVLDAAALGVPIITTQSTWHGPCLFPELIVESPYDIGGASRVATQLIEEPEFYQSVIDQAAAGLDWYKPGQTVARLMAALSDTKSL